MLSVVNILPVCYTEKLLGMIQLMLVSYLEKRSYKDQVCMYSSVVQKYFLIAQANLVKLSWLE